MKTWVVSLPLTLNDMSLRKQVSRHEAVNIAAAHRRSPHLGNSSEKIGG